jgi:hypothetical protein
MQAGSKLHAWLADGVLLMHAAWVAFVVVGFILIWVGYFRGWSFVRGFWWRLAHLLAMGIVTAEALGGLVCPLTEWEDRLRRLAGQGPNYPGSFIQHWVGRLLFYEVSERAFALMYAVFFTLVLLAFWIVKPRWPARPGRAAPVPVRPRD